MIQWVQYSDSVGTVQRDSVGTVQRDSVGTVQRDSVGTVQQEYFDRHSTPDIVTIKICLGLQLNP